MAAFAVTIDSVLAALSRERLFDLRRVAGASVRDGGHKRATLAAQLAPPFSARLPEVLRELRPRTAELPAPGNVLGPGYRQWFVEAVERGAAPGNSPLLRLALEPRNDRNHLVFLNLQTRLLSSAEAVARTLEIRARATEKAGDVRVRPELQQLALPEAPETHRTDYVLAAQEDSESAGATTTLLAPAEEARALLREMRALAEKARRQPDGKFRALLASMRAHLCPAIGLGAEPNAAVLFTNMLPAPKTGVHESHNLHAHHHRQEGTPA